MLTQIKLHSPQICKTIDSEITQKEDIYRSLQVQKSTNYIIDKQEDDKTYMLKKKTQKQQLSIFNDNLFGDETIQPKYQSNLLNQERILNIQKDKLHIESELNTVRNDDEQYETQLNSTTKLCCFCKQQKKLIQICPCSFAHQICATKYIQSGNITKKMNCTSCQAKYQFNGLVYFDFSSWKKHKLSLFIKTLFLIVVILSTYFYANKNNKQHLSEMICIYVTGFIISICILTQILQNFKNIQFEIKPFNSHDIEFNNIYLEEVLDQ